MDYTFHPGVNGSSPWVEFYPYDPSDSAGYAFVAIFGILTIAHFILMFPYRAASFIPLVIGGICTFPSFLPSLPLPNCILYISTQPKPTPRQTQI